MARASSATAASGKPVAKRHQNMGRQKRRILTREEIEVRLSNAQIRRLLKRGGIPRMGDEAVEDFRYRVVLPLIQKAVTVGVSTARSRKRRTLESKDVKEGFRVKGEVFYVDHVLSQASRKRSSRSDGEEKPKAEKPAKKEAADAAPAESKKERKTGPKSTVPQ